MYNQWGMPNFGPAGMQIPHMPQMAAWPPFYGVQQPNWFRPRAPMDGGFNFGIPPVLLPGLPGAFPAQPPPPPPGPPKENPPPPSDDTTDRNVKFEEEWKKYQDSLLCDSNRDRHLDVTDNPQLKEVIQEEEEFTKQFEEWMKQYTLWKDENKNHPNREQYHEYEQQWQKYETQMLEKQREIRERRNKITNTILVQPPLPPINLRLTRTSQSNNSPQRFQMPQPNWPRAEVKSLVTQNSNKSQQEWAQAGGKGDQVNFGKDINQRFPGSTNNVTQMFTSQQNSVAPESRSQQQHTSPWIRPQRPLLSLPTDQNSQSRNSNQMRSNELNVLNTNSTVQLQIPAVNRMGTTGHEPPEPNVQQPWMRNVGGHVNVRFRPRDCREESEFEGGIDFSKGFKPDPIAPNFPNATQRRHTRPLLADPDIGQNLRMLQPRGHLKGNEQLPPRFSINSPRRAPLLPLHQAEFEPDAKRMRMNAMEQNQGLMGRHGSRLHFPQQRFRGARPRSGNFDYGGSRPQFFTPEPIAFSPGPRGPFASSPRNPLMGSRSHKMMPASLMTLQVQPPNQNPIHFRARVPHFHHRPSNVDKIPLLREAPVIVHWNASSGKLGEEKVPDTVREKEEAQAEALTDVEGLPCSDKQAASPTNATNNPIDQKPVRDSKMFVGKDSVPTEASVKEVDVASTTDNKCIPIREVLQEAAHTSPEKHDTPAKWHRTPGEECSRNNLPQRSDDSRVAAARGIYDDDDDDDDRRHWEPEAVYHRDQHSWQVDRDWREKGWTHSDFDGWDNRPSIHDYQHRHPPRFGDKQPKLEDKDERYPSGAFQLSNNPFVTTVIDYGHSGLDCHEPPPVNPGRFSGAEVGESVFKHDRDFRAPQRQQTSDWRGHEMRSHLNSAEFRLGSSMGLNMLLRNEEPVVEKIPIESILLPPGRTLRPEHLVIMVRGLPGAGKTHISKLIKEREIREGGSSPRLLCLDDYFVTEVDKVVEEPETGKKVKKMVMEYEFDPALEASYKASFLKSFKKQVDDSFFDFIIVDATFDKKLYMDEFWSYSKSKGFQFYVLDVDVDVGTCTKRNEHKRTLADIQKIKDGWDETPRHYLQLNVQFLLQENAIEEVEMDNSSAILESGAASLSKDAEDGDEVAEPVRHKSKWELDTSELQLDKLDGLKAIKSVVTLEEYLQVPEDYEQRSSQPGKKRVRWADIEERKDLERMRKLGFVVGLTDWEKLGDETCVERALTKTKYI